MSQHDLNREISRATGESVSTIANMGFVELRPILFEHEPLTMDWDQPGLFMDRYKHDAQASGFHRDHSLARRACRKQAASKFPRTLNNLRQHDTEHGLFRVGAVDVLADAQKAGPLSVRRKHHPRRRHGDEVRLNTDRRFLVHAAQLGFHEIELHGSESPIVCRDERRVYFWSVLADGPALEVGSPKPALSTTDVSTAESSPFTEVTVVIGVSIRCAWPIPIHFARKDRYVTEGQYRFQPQDRRPAL